MVHLHVEVEAFSRRERNRGPRHARFSRDGVVEREPAAEILSAAKDPLFLFSGLLSAFPL